MKTIIASLFLAIISHTQSASAQILVKNGDKIAFLGDSITRGGWDKPEGYVRLVIAGLKTNGIEVEVVPAGISGHKSDQMLARLEKDVLAHKPQWMILSCGVNDVWHGPKGVPLDDDMAASGQYDAHVAKRGTYKKNITAIIDQASAANIRPVILTATMIKEDLEGEFNQKLAPYNEFLRELAKQKQLPIADLNALFQKEIKDAKKEKGNMFTVDGVHMNVDGNKLMAAGLLETFGLSASQIRKAEKAWEDLLEDPTKK